MQVGFDIRKCNLRRFTVLGASRTQAELLGTQVRGHQNQGVLEVHRTALAVRQTSIVKHLQQRIEHVRMRLLDFIEQNHAVRMRTHSFGQLAAFFVPHVSRRSTDQTAYAMLFHIFAHVDTDKRVFAIEKFHSQSLRQFRLTHARRAQEEETANRRVLATKAATVTQNSFGHGFDSFVLANHAGMQTFVQVQQLCLFAFAKFCHRNARPTAYHKRNRLFRDFFAQTTFFGTLAERFGLFGKFLFDVHNLVVLEFGSAVQVITGFGLFHLVLCRLQGFLQVLYFGKCGTAVLPAFLHLLDRRIGHGQIFTKFFQALYAICIRFLRQRLLLDFHLEFLTLQSIQRFRYRVHLRLHKACGLVDQINRLIR